MNEVRRNHHRQSCAECARPVEPNAGFLTRSERAHDFGQRLVYHEQCSPEHLRAVGHLLEAKCLTKEGNILHPFDQEAIPKLRALPGAWWNSSQRRWVVSLELHDRKLLLQKAEEIGLEVAPELREEFEAYKQKEASRHIRERSEAASQHGLELPQEVLEGALWIADRYKGILNLPSRSSTPAVLLAMPPGVCGIIVTADPAQWQRVATFVRPELKIYIREKANEDFQWPAPDELLLTTIARLPDAFAPDVIGVDDRGKEIKSVNFQPQTRARASKCRLVLDGIKQIHSYRTIQSQKFTGLVSQTLGLWLLGNVPAEPKKLWDALCVARMSRDAFGSFKVFKRCFQGRAGRWNQMEWGAPKEEALDRMERVCFRRPQLG